MSEYWIHEDGYVDFADGDVGDYNHEGIVILHLQNQIIDAVNLVCDPVDKYGRRFESDADWDEWQRAVAIAWSKELIEKNPQNQEKIEELLENDPDKFLMGALRAAGVKKQEWDTANGSGDARDYAMERWGWKTYRNGNIDTWRLTRRDMQSIVDGIDSISDQDGWSEKKFQKYRFTINVFSTGKHFYLTVGQMQRWISSPTASIAQDSTEEELMNKAATLGSRQQDLDLMHPHYRSRPGVNPFGDSVIPSFEDFLIEFSWR